MYKSEIKAFEDKGGVVYTWLQILVLWHILRQNGSVGQIDSETLHIILLSWKFKLCIKHSRYYEISCNTEAWYKTGILLFLSY